MDTVDVSAEIDITAAPADVAAVMFDAAREPEWMKVVTGVELIDPALERGARVRRTGTVLGQEFGWTTEVEAVHFPHVLTLRIVEGPFVGTVRYDIQRSGVGSRVRIRNVGEAKALGPLPAVMITGPMRSAMTADLERLKAIVEASA
jgi:uncharacterized membrane protein